MNLLQSLSSVTFSGLVCLLSISAAAGGGHEHGNGGGAIVCRDRQGQIRSAQLLDLWEARVTQRPLTDKQMNMDDFIQLGLRRLSRNNPLFGAHIRIAYEQNKALVQNIPPGTSLVSPDDTLHWLMEDGCKLEGAAQYNTSETDGDVLYIDPAIYNRLPVMDQAALWVHEAVYKVLRQNDLDENSRRARNYVALAFSKDGLPEVTMPSSFTCHYDLNSDLDSFNFSVMISTDSSRFRGWIMRKDKKWLIPSLPVIPFSPEKESEFLHYYQMTTDNPPSRLQTPTVVSLPLSYHYNGSGEVMTALLAPKVRQQSSSGPFFDFVLYIAAGVAAHCTQ